jgi:hypothetical protein
MACFNDLAIELQEAIWTLVPPYRGGIHWIEFEGVPHPAPMIRQALRIFRNGYRNQEPKTESERIGYDFNQGQTELNLFLLDKSYLHDTTTPYFKSLHLAVPSVWGQSEGPDPLGADQVLSQDMLDEIAETQRCRRLSTYTQVATMLSTCRLSRLVAQRYLYNMTANKTATLHRGLGPLYKPRHSDIWNQDYSGSEEVAWLTPQEIPITICPALDLVVFRLWNASGRPTPTLDHAFYQLSSEISPQTLERPLPAFARVGIEWHPKWSSSNIQELFCMDALNGILFQTHHATKL